MHNQYRTKLFLQEEKLLPGPCGFYNSRRYWPEEAWRRLSRLFQPKRLNILSSNHLELSLKVLRQGNPARVNSQSTLLPTLKWLSGQLFHGEEKWEVPYLAFCTPISTHVRMSKHRKSLSFSSMCTSSSSATCSSSWPPPSVAERHLSFFLFFSTRHLGARRR